MMPARKDHSLVRLKSLLNDIVEINKLKDCDILSLEIDSRLVKPGSLFFACKGTQVHGIEFALQAVKNGAAAILWEADTAPSTVDSLKGSSEWAIPVIEVDNLSEYVGVIAERFYAFPSRELSTVGITGTNGKTSCSHFLAHCLTTDTDKCGLIGTLGNGLYGEMQSSSHTTPDAISLHALFDEFRTLGAKQVVMEVSSHGLSQGRVAGVEFDLAIFTNLSRDHLDYHGDMGEYFMAKTRLFDVETLKYTIINTDDEFGRKLVMKKPARGRRICYGLSDRPVQCDFYVNGKDLNFSTQGTGFTLESSWGSAQIQTSLIGEFNVSNLLAVFGALLAMGWPLTDAVERIERCNTIAGRMEKVEGDPKHPMVVIDYAHTPDALEKALKALAAYKFKNSSDQVHSKLWCVFGCGGDRDTGKRPEMGRVAEHFSDYVVVTNDNPRNENAQHIITDILKGIVNVDAVSVESDRIKAISNTIDKASAKDIILIAGKGHEKYQVFGDEKLTYPGDQAVVKEKFEKVRQMGLSV